MNYGLMMSCQVEEILQQVVRDENWTQEHEARAYGEALETVMASRPDAWADGNIRIGDYILLSTFDSTLLLLIAKFYVQLTPTPVSPPTASSTPPQKWSNPLK